MRELAFDIKKPPRKVNEDEFRKLKSWERTTGTFQSAEKREEEYFKQHDIYAEDKKEGMDRLQLFYILEQFYEKSQRQPDSLSKPQELINEYFSDPDNTFFLDKNKIV